MSGLMGFEEAFQAADLAVRAVREDGLRDIERVVLEGSWNRQTYQKIAADAGYTEGYLSRDVGPALWTVLSDALGMQVKKTNFRTAIERWSKEHDDFSNHSPSSSQNGKVITALADIAETDAPPIDVSDFRGQTALLNEITDWMVNSRGRLLCLSGIPGVGKTWFSIKCTEQTRDHFQHFIYRDLSDRPLPAELVHSLLQRLPVEIPADLTWRESVELLIKALTQSRCLIVLDGSEVLYRPKQLAGTYEPEFEDYRHLLEALTSRDHQSCVLWVGRELPRTTAPMAGSSCRFCTLSGLDQAALSTLAFWPEDMKATAAEWQRLKKHYGGLPALISTEVAPRLSSFGNDLAACLTALQQDSRFISPYVEAWLAPLSKAEWQILTWMMICRRPLSLAQLSEYLGMAMPLNAIESLCDRGICRSIVNGEPRWELALPKLLHPYLCDRFLATFRKANAAQQLELLHRYPLLQAGAPEVVRQWQRQNLLVGAAALLEEQLTSLLDKQHFLQHAIQTSRELTETQEFTGYSAGNLINLAQIWQISLVDLDLRGLQLREADLQSDLFQGVSFAGANLSQTLLAKPLGPSPVVAVNPSQSQVAVGDQDGRLLLWDIADGRLQRALLTVSEPIRVIAFSYDGQSLAEGRLDGAVRLWDLQAEYGPELFATTEAEALTTLAFSPDRQLLVGGDEGGYLYVWRLASGEKIHQISAHQAAITAITFSPDSARIVTCGQDCAAAEWKLQTGERIHHFQGRLTSSLGAVAYLPNVARATAQSIVIGRDEGQLIIWDIESARPLRIMKEPCDLFMALALSPNGRYLAASDVSNAVSVWEVDSRSRLFQISESTAPVESLVFSPDSRELMTGCDYTVQRWQVRSGQCLRIWRSDRHPAIKLALASQPLQLLSGHDDQTLRSWQFSSHRQRWLPHDRLPVPDNSLISVIATDVSGKYWAIGTEAGNVHIWQRESSAWLTWPGRLSSSITVLSFSTSGHLLAVGDASGTVGLWDLAKRLSCWQKDQTHADRITALAFASDDQQLFSGSRDRAIQGWDIQGNAIATLAGHRRRIHALCLSADGGILYSASYDGIIHAWNLQNQTCSDSWQREDRYIHGIALDEQQQPVAIVSDTETIEIWDIAANSCRFSFTPHEETIWHVSTSPDGRALICAGQNGEISIWSLISGEQQGQLRVDRPYEGMQIGDSLGLTDSERQMLYSLGATDY